MLFVQHFGVALATNHNESGVDDASTQIIADIQATVEELTMKLLRQDEKFEQLFVQQKQEFEEKLTQQKEKFEETLAQQNEKFEEKLAQQGEKLLQQEVKLIHQEEEIASLKAVVMAKPDDVTDVNKSAVVAENGKLKTEFIIFMALLIGKQISRRLIKK